MNTLQDIALFNEFLRLSLKGKLLFYHALGESEYIASRYISSMNPLGKIKLNDIQCLQSFERTDETNINDYNEL